MMHPLTVKAKMETFMVGGMEMCNVILLSPPPATFIVHSSATAGVISLQNAKNTLNWLAIRDGKFIGDVSRMSLIISETKLIAGT